MNWNKAIELEWKHGGFVIFPYQFALGLSLRYWSCLAAIAIRIYCGPFKIWFSIPIKRKQAAERFINPK